MKSNIIHIYIKITSQYRKSYNLYIYIQIYIRLKIKPNSIRIRFLSCQIFFLPSTGFELTPLIHCSNHLLSLTSIALDHWTTSTPYIYIYIYKTIQYKLFLHLFKRRELVLAHILIIFSKKHYFSSFLKDIKSTLKLFSTLNKFSLKSS
jgi:hypothetical protein